MASCDVADRGVSRCDSRTALIYVRVVEALDEPMLAVLGWPVSLVTDLAIAYFVARIVFGLHPAIPFLLLLGIASDVIGFVVLALFSATGERHLDRPADRGGSDRHRLRTSACAHPQLLAISARRGGVSWFGFFWSGLHPALALVPIIPFLPRAARDPGFFVDALPTAKDTLSQFEVWWRYPAQAALFFFGLVNAGVPIGPLSPARWDCRLRSSSANPSAFSSGLASPCYVACPFRRKSAGGN
jgi:NhaA family Na+:H+ antiporter